MYHPISSLRKGADGISPRAIANGWHRGRSFRSKKTARVRLATVGRRECLPARKSRRARVRPRTREPCFHVRKGCFSIGFQNHLVADFADAHFPCRRSENSLGKAYHFASGPCMNIWRFAPNDPPPGALVDIIARYHATQACLSAPGGRGQTAAFFAVTGLTMANQLKHRPRFPGRFASHGSSVVNQAFSSRWAATFMVRVVDPRRHVPLWRIGPRWGFENGRRFFFFDIRQLGLGGRRCGISAPQRIERIQRGLR